MWLLLVYILFDKERSSICGNVKGLDFVVPIYLSFKAIHLFELKFDAKTGAGEEQKFSPWYEKNRPLNNLVTFWWPSKYFPICSANHVPARDTPTKTKLCFLSRTLSRCITASGWVMSPLSFMEALNLALYFTQPVHQLEHPFVS